MENGKEKIRKLENQFGRPNINLTGAQEKDWREMEKGTLLKNLVPSLSL